MSKPVAVDGDTQFETSTQNHPADTNKTGKWSLVSSSVTKGQKCSANGKLVELAAMASWTYAGGTAGSGPAVPVGPFPDSATLTAGNTLLTDNGSHILVDGDEATGSVDSGNKIVVRASQQKLKTD